MTLDDMMTDIGNTIIRMTDGKIGNVLEKITDKLNDEANGETLGGEPITGFSPYNYYTKEQVNGLIPRKNSDLYNDSGYLTEHQDLSGKQDKLTAGAGIAIDDDTNTIYATGVSSGKANITLRDWSE